VALGRLLSLLTALAAVCAAVLVAEAAMRLAFGTPSLGGDRALWRYDATKGWALTAGARGIDYRGGPDAGEVHINARGFRGPDVAAAKAPGQKRVLVLGDSFVFGVGVDEGSLVTAWLQRLLGAGHEVVNLGISGYSTDQQLILFEETGRRLRPDAVLLVMADNDFPGNTQDFVYRAYYKPVFETRAGALVRPAGRVPTLSTSEGARWWLWRHSLLWRRASALPEPLGRLFLVRSPRTSGDPLAVTLALVMALKESVEDAGATLVVFNTGHRGEETRWHQSLRPLLRERGCLFLGLEETLGRARLERPGAWDFGRDSHWNVDAHRLVAEIAKAFFERHAVLEDRAVSPAQPSRSRAAPSQAQRPEGRRRSRVGCETGVSDVTAGSGWPERQCRDSRSMAGRAGSVTQTVAASFPSSTQRRPLFGRPSPPRTGTAASSGRRRSRADRESAWRTARAISSFWATATPRVARRRVGEVTHL